MENKALQPFSQKAFLEPGVNFTKYLETFTSDAMAKPPTLQAAS